MRRTPDVVITVFDLYDHNVCDEIVRGFVQMYGLALSLTGVKDVEKLWTVRLDGAGLLWRNKRIMRAYNLTVDAAEDALEKGQLYGLKWTPIHVYSLAVDQAIWAGLVQIYMEVP